MSFQDILGWSYAPFVRDWSGFLAPVSIKEVFNSGSTIPVKFQLTDNSAGKTDLVATLAVDGTPVGTFRYDAAADQYIYNLSTTGMAPGTHTLTMTCDDGQSRHATIRLK